MSDLRIVRMYEAVVTWWNPRPDDCQEEMTVGYYADRHKALREAGGEACVMRTEGRLGVATDSREVYLAEVGGTWHRIILDAKLVESDVHL